MISALCWVKQGAAAQRPRKFELTEDEFDKIALSAGMEIAQAKEELAEALAAQIGENGERLQTDEDMDSDNERDAIHDAEEGVHNMKVDSENRQSTKLNNLDEYNMDEYDNEPIGGTENVNIFGDMRSLTYYGNETDDPYLLPAGAMDEQELEDLEILPTDMLLCLAKTSEQVSCLEVQVFEAEDANLYTHHDYMLPTFPLALEWMDLSAYASTSISASDVQSNTENTRRWGNLLAVGGFEPDIEVWDLDIVDALYPIMVLGSTTSNTDGKKNKKSKKIKSKKMNNDFHVDSVLGLSWNCKHSNFLASCSADTTVKIWDLNTQRVVRSYTPHDAAKVSIVRWCPAAPEVLLTSGYDATLRAFDTRAADQKLTIKLLSDAEDAHWAPTEAESQLAVSTEDGHVYWYDVRNTKSSMWTLHAHDSACSSISLKAQSLVVKGDTKTKAPVMTMATGGSDGVVKVWDLSDNKPSMMHSRNMDVGKIFCVDWCPNEDNVLAVGGSRGSIVWQAKGGNIIRSNDGDISGDDDEDER